MSHLLRAGLLGLLLLLLAACSRDRTFESLDESLSVETSKKWVWAYDISAPYDIKLRHVSSQTLFLINTIDKEFSPSQDLLELSEMRCREFLQSLGTQVPELEPVELDVDSMAAIQYTVPYSVEGQQARLIDTTVEDEDCFYRMLGLVSQEHYEKMVPILAEVIASFRVAEED